MLRHIAILILLPLTVLAPTGSAGDNDITCTPTTYHPKLTITTVEVDGGETVGKVTFYLVRYSQGMQNYIEIWQDINGQDGLQMTSAQACGDTPDKRFEQICYARCLVPM